MDRIWVSARLTHLPYSNQLRAPVGKPASGGISMQKSLIALSGALVLMSVTPALAQSASQPILAGAPTPNVLRAGTAVPLKMAEALTTKGKKLRVGYRFMLEIAEPVTVNGQIVIPAGSPVTGEVTDVRNKGMWGKSGHINARVLFVRANGRQIRMTGQLDDKGVTGTAGVVARDRVRPDRRVLHHRHQRPDSARRTGQRIHR
jgi:hypothetical protein